MIKLVQDLEEADYRAFPVWEFCALDDRLDDEMSVRPVEVVPVDDLDGRFIGCKFMLKDGSSVFGVISNIDPFDALFTSHYVTISIFVNEKLVHLSRYHDVDSEHNTAEVFSKSLGKSVEQVFPILYDISDYLIGQTECVRNYVSLKHPKQLSREELRKLLFESGRRRFDKKYKAK